MARQHDDGQSGEARIAGYWAGYGVDGAPARGGNHEQIRLVCERRQRRADHKAEVVLGQRSLRNQGHLARTVELVGPSRRRSLIRNDGGHGQSSDDGAVRAGTGESAPRAHDVQPPAS